MIDVTVVYAPAPHLIETERLRLSVGALVRDAFAVSALLRRLGVEPRSDAQSALRLGLWGCLCEPDAALQAGDRLELLRGLQADPMEARRQRLRREGLRKVQRAPRKPPRR